MACPGIYCLFDIISVLKKDFQNRLSLGQVGCYNRELCKNQCILINS